MSLDTTRPIRVLHIINTLERGGAEQHLLSLFRSHDPAVVRPSVLTLYNRQPLAAEFRKSGFHVGTLGLTSLRQGLTGVAKLRTLIERTRPDIIQTALLESDIIGRVAARLAGHPRVVSAVHAPIYDPVVRTDNPHLRRWKLEVVRKLDQWTGTWSNALYVGCSEYVMQTVGLALQLPQRQQQVVYNGVAVAAAPRRANPHPYRLISVGRLDPQKGHAYLIEAMAAVVAAYPQAELWIVGAGYLQPVLASQIEQLGLSQQIRLLGIRADVAQLFAQSSVFVFPSLWEAMPIAPLEALSAGLPVVGTDIAPLREIVDDGAQGLLVPARSPAALAQAIISLLGQPDRRQAMGAAGRQRIIERFNIDVTARRWEALYQRMVVE
jgi:glycosyltransferase involved in cell wall biosynthesis